ncbi:MAG: hypothetical protein IH986_01805 [Planctomycetes bacterium]|nr:hypothetical protein [Planctomycetota bacterium]
MKRITHTGLWLVLLGAISPAGAQTAGDSKKRAPANDKSTAEVQEYWLRVTSERVNLRSRPDANSVVVTRLARDALLRAAQERFGWHRVRPPTGVFSYVAAEFVDQRAPDRGIVSVRTGRLRVRVGSSVARLDPMKHELQTLLKRGSEVRILGRDGDWLRIVPPQDVQFFVSADHVERVDDEVAARLRAAATAAAERAKQPGAESAEKNETGQASPEGLDLSGAWGQRLAMVETAIQAEGRKPMESRAWAELIGRLRPIADQRREPTVARLAAEWIGTLELRVASRSAALAAREIERAEARDRARFQREIERIRQTRAAAESHREFQATGQLLRSHLKREQKAERRYMLRDPLTGRVVAYVERARSEMPSLESFVGKFVGVRGVAKTDAKLGADIIRVSEVLLLQRDEPTSRSAREAP